MGRRWFSAGQVRWCSLKQDSQRPELLTVASSYAAATEKSGFKLHTEKIPRVHQERESLLEVQRKCMKIVFF